MLLIRGKLHCSAQEIPIHSEVNITRLSVETICDKPKENGALEGDARSLYFPEDALPCIFPSACQAYVTR